MAEARKYPTPVTNPETAQFWEAAKAGKFMIKRCTACGEPHYFPRSICPFCFSDKTVWEESSGEGTIYTYSLMRKSPTGPYAIVRHPMYAGGSLYLFATPLALGSYWGLAPIAASSYPSIAFQRGDQ